MKDRRSGENVDFSGSGQMIEPSFSTAAAIVLLRHGETENDKDADGGAVLRGSRDDLLTAGGWRQMASSLSVFEHGEGNTRKQWRKIREEERNECEWDEIVSSPLLRCRLFAERYARQRGVPLRIDARLAEMHFGAWEGMSISALMQRDGEALARFWRDPEAHPPPEGEPLSRFFARVREAWEELAARCRERKTGEQVSGKTGQTTDVNGDSNPKTDEGAGKILVVTHGGPIRVILCLSEDAIVPERLTGADLLRHEVGHGSLHRLCRMSDGGWQMAVRVSGGCKGNPA